MILTEAEQTFFLRNQESPKIARKHPHRTRINTVPTRIRTSSFRMLPAVKARMVISRVKIPIVRGAGIMLAIERSFTGYEPAL